jgi:hypothetical protein
MDSTLVAKLIERDWPTFLRQLRLLDLGVPELAGTRIDMIVAPRGSTDQFVAVLECDNYDAQAPLLDFADMDDRASLGAAHWPRIEGAPMNSVSIDGRSVPILCTPGTRGYHVHSSHMGETHAREVWRLPAVATLLHRFLRMMGSYQGRGL